METGGASKYDYDNTIQIEQLNDLDSTMKVYTINSSLRNFIRVPLQNSNAKIDLFLDTGSDICILKQFKVPPKSLINRAAKCKIQGVTDGIVYSLGTVEISILIGTDTYSFPFQVVEDDFPISTDGILGRDFIISNNLDLLYSQMEVIFGSAWAVPIFDTARVYKSIHIPPNSEAIHELPNLFERDSVVKGGELAKGIYLAHAIVARNNPIIQICNVTNIAYSVKIIEIERRIEPLSNYRIIKLDTQIYTENKEDDEELTKRQEELTEILLSKAPPYNKEELTQLCMEFVDIFFLKGDKISYNNFYEQQIHLTDDIPIYIKQYKIPHAHKEEMKRQVKEHLEGDLVEPSMSPYNNPVLLVPKKSPDGTKKWRFVVDFRQLNKKLIPDRYPLPRIDDIFDNLGNSQFFSTLDLASGFHQIKLEKESRRACAFSTPLGQFQFKRLPFGLSISPNSFSRMMAIAFNEIIPERAFLYIDDLIVLGYSSKNHLANLRKVFEICRRVNLKLNPLKCDFFRSEVTYLGHRLTREGIKPDPEKFQAIRNYPVPTSKEEVKRFVAFCNYYRKFVQNFNQITGCLNDLTKKKSIFLWTERCQASFDLMKSKLTNPPILAYPNFSREFIITTDASDLACGAVLSQLDDEGNDKPVQYASRSFTQGEKNKPVIEKELVAIHWAVNIFKPYVYGTKFLIKTDHRPLVFLFNLKNPTSRLARIRLDLQEYDFDVEFVKGTSNVCADALSRVNIQDLKDKYEQVLNLVQMFVVTRSMTKNQLQQTSSSVDVRKPREYENFINEVMNAKPYQSIPTLSFNLESSSKESKRKIDSAPWLTAMVQSNIKYNEERYKNTKNRSQISANAESNVNDKHMLCDLKVPILIPMPNKRKCTINNKINNNSKDNNLSTKYDSNNDIHVNDNNDQKNFNNLDIKQLDISNINGQIKNEIQYENEHEKIQIKIAIMNILTLLTKKLRSQGIEEIKINENDNIFKIVTKEEFLNLGVQLITENSANELFNCFKILIVPNPIKVDDLETQLKLVKDFHEHPLLGGHCGPMRLLTKLKQKYIWKHMRKQVFDFCKKCVKCQLNKAHVQPRQPMTLTTTPQRAFDFIEIDTVGPLPASGNFRYILTIQCRLTKFVCAAPLVDKSATEIAKAIFNNFMYLHGFPAVILTDNGSEYKNQLVDQLMKILNIDHKFSMAYRPQTLASLERNHRVLNSYFRMYQVKDDQNWSVLLPYYCFAWNTTPNEQINDYTPYELVYGKKPSMPEIVAGQQLKPVYDIDNYVSVLQRTLAESQNKAKLCLNELKLKRKLKYDTKIPTKNFKEGDIVKIRNESRKKLEPFYEGPYTIVSINNPNCVIMRENDVTKYFIHMDRISIFND